MTKLVLSSTMILGVSTGSAYAHGDHSGNMLQLIGHMLSEPDHLAMLSIAAVAIVFLARKARRQA